MSETVRSILRSKGGQVWWLPPEATVYDAIAVMAEKSIGAIMVISYGKLIGVVSERDYARKVILRGRLSKETVLSEIMSSPVVTANPDDTVDDCMRTMTLYRIRHQPVLEDDKVIGMISIGDLVKSIISSQAETIHQLNAYITGR